MLLLKKQAARTLREGACRRTIGLVATAHAFFKIDGDALKDFLILRTGRGDNNLFRRYNQRSFSRHITIKHLFHHRLKAFHDSSFGHIRCHPFDLISFETLRIIGRNGNPATIIFDIVQSNFQKNMIEIGRASCRERV